MKYIDLHVHSNCSDGTLSPSELVSLAMEKDLAAIALTDHDTIDGLQEFFAAAKDTSLEVIAGIEFSTEYHGKDIHIVGLDFNPENPEFLTELSRFQNARDLRNEKMIQLLQEQGSDITWDAMKEEFGDAVWTRAHFGRYLFEHHFVPTLKDAFTLYLADDACCFVPREEVTPSQAVALIRLAGGIPVLAHPMLYHFEEDVLDELVCNLKKEGLVGIEGFYSTYSEEDEKLVAALAEKYELCLSGGSDFHGSNKPTIALGTGCDNLHIPYELWEKLHAAK